MSKTAELPFRTQFNRPNEDRYLSDVGERVEIRHSAHIDTNGRRFLAKDKPIAIYDLIQSHKEECEIENIIRRAVEGDYNALNAKEGIFMDITNCPSSIAEAQQYIINAKEEFDKLPKEIKQKFEFNPEVYIAEMSGNTEGWLDKMGYTEKIKLQEEKIKRNQIDNENFSKAMATLATGNSVSNTGGEVNE